MSAFNPRWIIGKTIASVDMRPFKAHDFDNTVAHDPIIKFTDGSSIRFVAEETDGGEYGTSIVYRASTE